MTDYDIMEPAHYGAACPLSLNTLRLLHALLCTQPINAGAPRADIEAVIAAREELELAIKDQAEEVT